MKVKLSLSKGSLMGHAFVLDLEDDDGNGGGTVLAGSPAGYVNPVFSYFMSQSDVERSIDAFKGALKRLTKQNKKLKKGIKK